MPLDGDPDFFFSLIPWLLSSFSSKDCAEPAGFGAGLCESRSWRRTMAQPSWGEFGSAGQGGLAGGEGGMQRGSRQQPGL